MIRWIERMGSRDSNCYFLDGRSQQHSSQQLDGHHNPSDHQQVNGKQSAGTLARPKKEGVLAPAPTGMHLESAR